MQVTDWIISLSGAALATMMAVATYFMQKWIQSVDEKLKEQTKDIQDNTRQIISLSAAQNFQTENITQAVQTQLSAFKYSFKNLEQEVSSLGDLAKKRILPLIDRQTEQLGKVIVLEERQREQDEKLIKLYEVIRQVVQKLPGQK